MYTKVEHLEDRPDSELCSFRWTDEPTDKQSGTEMLSATEVDDKHANNHDDDDDGDEEDRNYSAVFLMLKHPPPPEIK